jgi:hypothetical protein
MKPCRTTLTWGMALVWMMASLALAVPRTALLESFVQWNSPYCAVWNSAERQLLEPMGRDSVVTIKYHVWWPSPDNDPFFHWNTSEAAARASYYYVPMVGVPMGVLDGRSAFIEQTAAQLRDSVRAHCLLPAPCTISLEACSPSSVTVDFSGMVIASDSALTGTGLFAALITEMAAATGGAGGESEFYDVFRDLWPNSNGLTFSVALRDTYRFSGTLNKDSSWNPADLSVVAFVQDAGRWMHQAAIFPVRLTWGAELSSDDPLQIFMEPIDQADYLILMKNVSCHNDTYTVRLSGHLFYGWTRSVESPGIPAHADSIRVPLVEGEQAWLHVRVSANGYTGMALTEVAAASGGNPAMQARMTFRTLARPSVLVVDDDGGPEFGNVENYVLSALPPIEPRRSYGVWDAALEDVPQELLTAADLVIWFSGANALGASVSALEQVMLGNLLSRGGALLLTGQSIPFDLRGTAFLSDYLHTRFQTLYPQAQTVSGVSGDPISDGLDFSIHGGDGANNQLRPSTIAPDDDLATVAWEYSGSSYHAGVRVQGTNYRAVLMGFGIEAIDNAADRDSVLARTVRWLVEGLAANPLPTALPHRFSLGAAYPNPFNPVTTITYTLAERAQVRLRIFDLLGRQTALLISAVQEAGKHQVLWDASGWPSGLYFCRLDAAAFQATQKLMLLK